jgi:hypothetical protein
MHTVTYEPGADFRQVGQRNGSAVAHCAPMVPTQTEVSFCFYRDRALRVQLQSSKSGLAALRVYCAQNHCGYTVPGLT